MCSKLLKSLLLQQRIQHAGMRRKRLPATYSNVRVAQRKF